MELLAGVVGGERPARSAGSSDDDRPISCCPGTYNPGHSLTGETICPPMVDTLSLVVVVSEEVLEVLSTMSGRRVLIAGTGEIERDVPRIGSLPGSYDPNLWVQPWTLDGAPALRLEGSAHRHILGHNVYGGPFCPIEAARYMIAVLERYLGIDLPPWQSWACRRVDLAWVFDPGSESAALAFITELSRSLVSSTAARSCPRTFGTTAYLGRVKLYMKGPEVKAHAPLYADKREMRRLVDLASSKLRFEVKFTLRELHRLTSSKLRDLDIEPLIKQAHEKLEAFTRTTDNAMQQVRTTSSVQARLLEMYSAARASSLMGTWYRLTTLGERQTRDHMSKPTFYRHMAELKAAGVSWTGTDIVRIHALAFPEDFSLSLSSPYLDRSGQHPMISQALQPYSIAS